MRAVAILRKCRMSPRKVRIVADMIRGMNVVHALNYLQHNSKKATEPLSKLLLSSIANWHNKNGSDYSGDLYISEIRVDPAGMLKRIKPAPQGRAHRIRKRFNHITIAVDSKENIKKTITLNTKSEVPAITKKVEKTEISKMQAKEHKQNDATLKKTKTSSKNSKTEEGSEIKKENSKIEKVNEDLIKEKKDETKTNKNNK